MIVKRCVVDSYRFNKGATDVMLNTTLHQQWWPSVLKVTG